MVRKTGTAKKKKDRKTENQSGQKNKNVNKKNTSMKAAVVEKASEYSLLSVLQNESLGLLFVLFVTGRRREG